MCPEEKLQTSGNDQQTTDMSKSSQNGQPEGGKQTNTDEHNVKRLRYHAPKENNSYYSIKFIKNYKKETLRITEEWLYNKTII